MKLPDHRSRGVNLTYLSVRALLLLVEMAGLATVARGMACYMEAANLQAGFGAQLGVGIIAEISIIIYIARQELDRSLRRQRRWMALADGVVILLFVLGWVIGVVVDLKVVLSAQPEKHECRLQWAAAGAILACAAAATHILFALVGCVECCISRSRRGQK